MQVFKQALFDNNGSQISKTKQKNTYYLVDHDKYITFIKLDITVLVWKQRALEFMHTNNNIYILWSLVESCLIGTHLITLYTINVSLSLYYKLEKITNLASNTKANFW